MSQTTAVLELRSVWGTGGGPEKTILVGAERINRRRFAVTVCYLRDLRDTTFGIDERAAGRDVDYVEARERHSFDPRIWNTLRTIVGERRIDIIHGHDYKTDLIAWFLARRAGARAVATAHGWTGHSARERFVYYPFHKRLLARFPRVIAVSSEIKDELVRHGARPERITVLLNAIDPAAFRRIDGRGAAVRASLGIAADAQVIGAVGRLEPQKRFDLLIRAAAGLLAEHPALQLVIVGAGSQDRALRQQAAACGMTDRCHFLGHRTDIADLHHAFDVFVQSSKYEGTPNAVLEAMAMDTPIVATDAGGTRELMTPDVHGLLVPIEDVDALQRAIRTTLTDPSSARGRAAAARRRVERELSFDARTRRLEEIYENLYHA